MVALRATGLHVRRGGRDLLGPLDLALDGAGCTVVMGPNGAGKTTLLRALHGLERLTAGAICCGMPQAQARLQQAFVFQTPVLLRRDVLDNIAYPLRLRGIGRAQARARAADWAARVGLGARALQSAQRLSGGEKQKLAVARALIGEPAIVFLDEPCANLDGASMREIEAILLAAKAAGTKLVMATHQIGQARRLADRVIFLHKGQVVTHGDAASLLHDPAHPMLRAYLNGDILE